MKSTRSIFMTVMIILTACQPTKTLTAQNATSDTFTFALIEQSLQDGENLFISPASAAIALRMLIPGANGTTLTELQDVVPQMSLQPTEQLEIASALWLNQGVSAKSSFIQANSDAEIFRGPITTEKVNLWASEHTNGKVTRVLQDPLPAIQMMLTNALYFKADWASPFSGLSTHRDSFYGTRTKRPINMLQQTSHFDYLETKYLQVIRLPYRGDYCMDIYMPRNGQTINNMLQYIQQLDMALLENKKVNLNLPKFKLECDKTLNDYLKAMGLKTCFTQQADFSGISFTPLYVDFVKQNTYLSIDESGTQAAAVTTMGMAKTSYRPEPEEVYDMKINRPFLFFIREMSSNQIIFYGVIYNL